MARGDTETPESYTKWLLDLLGDFRSPDKDNFENVVKSNGEQKKRDYEDAKADAARTGDPKDIAYAKKLKEIVAIYNKVVKARELTDKAQALYNNIDSNRKKIESLRALGEGNTDEAKKIQRQLTRARAGLQAIETERDAFGPKPKGETKPVVDETPATGNTEKTPAPATPVKDTKPAASKGGDKETTSPMPAPLTTTNPVTGEVIKVSDIKPDTGIKAPAATVGPNALPPVDRTGEASGKLFELGLQVSKNLFENVPGLKAIYDEYVDPKSKMTDNEFTKRVRQEPWFLKNSKEIKTRFINYYNYLDMKETGQSDGSTDFEKQLQRLESKLQKRAVEMGSAIASDPNAISQLAEKLYLSNDSEDDNVITQRLAAAIRPIAGIIGGKTTEGYSGQALINYNTLLQTARNNGFKISDILPGVQTEQQVLAAIASGDIDINRVAQDARKLAAQGQPQYVRDLLAQGYNLDQVFSPYRQTMANVLGLGNENEIDLNDPLLRTAITDKGDMNLYDFKKALRQDNRWQYTEQAKQDVSTAALNVLRDFGFQG